MASKKAKKKKGEARELEEEALVEWLSRGLTLTDFTMEKMLKLWMEEDGNEDEDGEDALADKQELVQSFNMLGPVVEQAKEYVTEFKEMAISEAKRTIAAAKRMAEIPPLRRRRLLREHVRDVHQMDADTQKYGYIKRRFLKEYEEATNADAELQFGLKKRNKSNAPLLSRFREMKDEADKEQHARILADIEQKRRECMDCDLQEKRCIREQKEQDAADQLVYRRQMNTKFWKKQLEEVKAFAESQSHAQEVQEEFEYHMEQTKSEIQYMHQQESEDVLRNFDRIVTKSSIGVFDTSFQAGEWNSASGGGHRPGMDEFTVEVTNARGYIAEHELKRIELMEVRSNVMRLREKLEQIEQVTSVLALERRTILERKGKVLAEIKQIGSEHDELSQTLAGPPRRDANEDEKMQFHVLVARRASQMQQLADLNSRLENIEKRAQITVRSEASFRISLKSAQESEARLEDVVSDIDKDHAKLPVVIGRGIFRSENASNGSTDGDLSLQTVTAPYTDPNALLAQVTMASKLELLKNAAGPVRDHYKKTKSLATEKWKWGEHKVLAEQELEVTKTRLADVRARFVEQQKSNLRADLMHAIMRYHQGGNKLRKCIFPLKGYIEWWQRRNSAKTSRVCFAEHLDGMHLEKPYISGRLKGSFRFPKRCGYRVQIIIRLSRIDNSSDVEGEGTAGDSSVEEESEDSSTKAIQSFKFYIGGDYDCLQEYVFQDPSGKALRTGELSFEYFGSKMCYCFEFNLRSELGWRESRQFVVSNVGKYDERIDDFRDEERRIQLVQKEKHFVSELVKTIRLQSKQTSSERCAELLKELVLIEKSRAKTWDSKLLHGHEQRFSRGEYAKMLRMEIKKEVSYQIDQDVAARKALGRNHADDSRIDPKASITPGFLTDSELSQMKFLARKFALVKPQMLKSKTSLGDYCSFKSATENDHPHIGANAANMAKMKSDLHPQSSSDGSYRKELMMVGLRFEWREGKSKLCVMHKLCGISSTNDQESGTVDLQELVKDKWCQIDSVNAVFLSSAYAKAIQAKRDEEAKTRVLHTKKEEQVRQLQNETSKTILEEQQATQREHKEDEWFREQKEHDLARRKMKSHSNAIRLTTYNESISAQIDFQIQRRKNALMQEKNVISLDIKTDDIVHDVKEKYVQQYMEGRLALAKKTWERKEKRIADKREKDRKERDFRIQQENQLVEEIVAKNERELANLQADHGRAAKEQLKIPNFQLAIRGQYPCEHRDVKSWGSKYDMGVKCKQCGKEMSKSFDEPNHMRGVDPSLDRDVKMHRGHDAGGPALKFKTAKHLKSVEDERVRLEKEAGLIQLSDSVLYDRMNPEAIDKFNFRHGFDRGVLLANVSGSDPLYQRVTQEIHRASFQGNVLFHGRLRNFHFRINQLNELHAHFTTLLAVQRDFLENAQVENEFVMEKLPLMEYDYARAVRLSEEDLTAFKRLEAAKKELSSAQKEREAASHAIEGVEEEAEFAEFHVPSLVRSSNEMTRIRDRMSGEYRIVKENIVLAQSELVKAEDEKAKADGLVSYLNYRTPGTIVRTKFGFAEVTYYREEDSCMVLSCLDWEGAFFFPLREVTAYELIFREEECIAMACEEETTRKFYQREKVKENAELKQMSLEDKLVRTIAKWRVKKEEEEVIVRQVLSKAELSLQLQYQLSERKKLFEAAAVEAKQLQQFARVSLKRRGKPAHPHQSRLDHMRVTRACEKRMAMAFMEGKLANTDRDLRAEFARGRDAMYVSELSEDVLSELLGSVMEELCAESAKEGLHVSKELQSVLNNAIIPSETLKHVFVHTHLGLDRLWFARKKKYELLHSTWQQEMAKLGILKKEIARREEIRRLEEEERICLENRRKEMLAEERFCRKFYLEETVLYMQERKAMANAEMEMREYIRQLEIEAMKTKYAKMMEDRNHSNDKAARRLEIKLGKNEKHRLHREWTHIKEEDELATQIRERKLAIAQAEALERQFDKYLIQQAIDGKVVTELEASRLAERVREAQRVAAEKRAAFEAKLVQERMVATVEMFHTLSKVELVWMEKVERATYWVQRLVPLEANLRQLEPELKRIMEEREHVVADARMKREHAQACQKRLKEANDALEEAIKKEDITAKAYKKIHFTNSTMDSEVIHGRPQRFNTIYLREQLHQKYFLLLTESIIRKAIVQCSEREVVRLEQKLKDLHQERIVKSKEVSRVKRKHRRATHYSLKRSELGKLMFGGTQRHLLKEKFQQWVKLWSQRIMVRASFELKHSLLLQQQQIQKSTTLASRKVTEELSTKLSILHDHQKRRAQCRLCKREYSEEQNNRYGCLYHPGAYELACVRSCSTRRTDPSGLTISLSASCMIHRARRWLCCDETDEGRYGSNGCARRYHMPVRSNPALDKLVAKTNEKEQNLLEQIDQQLLELKERNVVGKMKVATKSVITKIEQELAEKRTIAAKYYSLDHR